MSRMKCVVFKCMMVIGILSFLLSCRTVIRPEQFSIQKTADILFKNGIIITMEDDVKLAEFVAVKDGKIVALGSSEDEYEWQSDSTRIVDLNGKILLPGFIDAHSHFAIAMRMIAQANISSPPVSNVNNINDILSNLKVHANTYKIKRGDWIMAWGYDPDLIDEKRHPTKFDLDELFPENPVFLLHVSAHMAVVNSQALALANITNETPDPDGGIIVRVSDSDEPNGLLQETAMYGIITLLPKPTPEQSFILLKETVKFYAAHGITTAQDGRTDFEVFQFLSAAAQKEKLSIDLNCLANIEQAKTFLECASCAFNVPKNGVNLSGFKLVGDGSPQGKTAYFTKSYVTQVPGCIQNCKGFSNVSQERINDLVRMSYKNNIQLYSHANGDASIDMLLEAHQEAIDSLNIETHDMRTVVIHSQFVRPDQLDAYAEYNFIPSFFTNHAFYWGDVHLKNLGKERASFLSPLKSAIDKNITFTNHTDYIVTPLDQMFLLWSAVNRKSRNGNVIGPTEQVSPWEGLKAITINAAYQHKQENIKGSIKIGKLADFVILDKNPLDINPEEIRNIKVLQTVKEGNIIYDISDSRN